MCKLALFDKNNEKIKEEKLKVIEILMILGVIIGSVELKKENHDMNAVFGLFLIGSILYYFLVSNTDNYRGVIFAAVLTALSFSAVVILPFIDGSITAFYNISIWSLFIVLSILAFFVLYVVRKEEIEKEKGKI